MPSRTKPDVTDRASLFAGIYYNRRSAERADDILFPLVWNLNDRLTHTRTTIVGPLVNRSAPGEHDNWLAPLYFTGKRKTGGYALIPPLLTYTNHDDQGGFNLVGPMFCSGRAARVRRAHRAKSRFRRRAALFIRAKRQDQVRDHPAAAALLPLQ